MIVVDVDRDCRAGVAVRSGDRGEVQDRERHRRGRTGDGRAGDAPAAQTAGGDQVSAPSRGRHDSAGRPAVPRSAGGVSAARRTRGADRRRRFGRGCALHRHGVPGRRRSERAAVASGSFARRRGRRIDSAGLRRRRRGARSGDRPPRSQAVEPVRDRTPRRHTDAEGPRLRSVQDRARTQVDRGCRADTTGDAVGLTSLHVSRAGAGPSRRRRPLGHLGARRDPARALDGNGRLSRARRRRRPRRDLEARTGAAVSDAPRGAARGRACGLALLTEAPRASVRHGARAGRGAGWRGSQLGHRQPATAATAEGRQRRRR